MVAATAMQIGFQQQQLSHRPDLDERRGEKGQDFYNEQKEYDEENEYSHMYLAREFSDYVSGFMRVEGTDAYVKWWAGRTGNQLGQVVGAVLTCQLLNLKTLSFPPSTSLDEIVELPVHKLLVTPDPLLYSQAGCRPAEPGKIAPLCDRLHLRHWRAAAATHVVPHFSRTFERSCRGEDNDLVIHLRSGDCLGGNPAQCSTFAPCSFFDNVIQQNQFQKVHIVTEPDLKHPCIRTIKERSKNATVTVTHDFSHDACLLSHAKNVALGTTKSKFTHLLAEIINPNIQQVFFVQEPRYCSAPWYCRAGDFTPISRSKLSSYDTIAPVRMCYSVKGVSQKRPFHDKMHFLTSCPASEVALASKCPMEESSSIWPLDWRGTLKNK